MRTALPFFANRKCKYYPCHRELNELNCMFCYCPLYKMESCPGTPTYFEHNGKQIKDCSNCLFPHRAENYGKMMEAMKEAYFN
ncbi:MAG: cysteine-rich small domain-containing protein [Lachnospiraceae bacterium]|nr:cysteine-rich small domain-containing protein [Lachnospiraceae bacterium]